MTPIPFKELMHWIFEEKEATFGVKRKFRADSSKFLTLFNEKMELPLGPAAGPHSRNRIQTSRAAVLSSATPPSSATRRPENRDSKAPGCSPDS